MVYSGMLWYMKIYYGFFKYILVQYQKSCAKSLGGPKRTASLQMHVYAYMNICICLCIADVCSDLLSRPLSYVCLHLVPVDTVRHYTTNMPPKSGPKCSEATLVHWSPPPGRGAPPHAVPLSHRGGRAAPACSEVRNLPQGSRIWGWGVAGSFGHKVGGGGFGVWGSGFGATS